jgi:heat shock protein HslJ
MTGLLKNAAVAVSVLMLCVACSGGPKFTEAQGKEWKLVEIRTSPENIVFNRSTLISEGFGDIFTLRFEPDRVQGMAAPNRFFGPYELGKGQNLVIKNVAGTLMAPIREPEKLKEHDYFIYLQNATRWDINNKNLELYTKSEDSQEAVMVFVAE